MTRSDWLALARLPLLPVLTFWAVVVLVPWLVLRSAWRYYHRPARVRERRWRIEQNRRSRILEKHERETVAMLRRRGLPDTFTNRAMLRR